uniref:fructose-bisphosphate aldolase n=1 Tax=Ditylum brightwellii TaxID=49249 RepID=A0A6U3QIG3_9STRA|mmetsp:Transcript_19294/g.28798  ORF Transcript_19294/g.28798 Transcript_19294/m.28798 type:complete len:296 (+) Transcript_19294:158-1045(+)
MTDAMMKKAASADGFIAALDQSGGSTPKALTAYGVPTDSYVVGEVSMYDKVHEMRSRIITSASFTGEKVLGAILFENTMDRTIEGKPTAKYLWEEKGIVPFLKCDSGLAAEVDGVQLMKPMPELDALLSKGVENGVFGTKMRSLINFANPAGIKAIVEQQFEVALQIIGHGLCPIIEPEVNIKSSDKEASEEILKKEILEQLNALDDDKKVMLKLSLPSVDNIYKELVDHPKVVRVVALSGGYSRDNANAILSCQTGMIASFSRALLDGVAFAQTQDEFDATLKATIDCIAEASK